MAEHPHETLRSWWFTPLLALYRRVGDTSAIDADAAMWAERNEPWAVRRRAHKVPTYRALPQLLADYPEFRNLFYYRVEAAGGHLTWAVKIARRIWPPVPDLDLGCDDIGPGMVISHGFGTVLTAERIGRNCWVHHQVTIGWDYGGGRSPVIGDDVFIGTGAKILGPITVGDGARIGANAVVVKDVPAGATVVGVPARVVRQR